MAEARLVTPTATDRRIAALAALAVTIHLAEAALPSPLPGFKPGLANVITVAALYCWGWSTAAWVTTLRVLVSGLLLGTFLSPTFALSAGGAIASLAALAVAVRLPATGPLGASILAALAHTTGQFLAAWWLFIPHPDLPLLLPPLLTLAVIAGAVSGTIATVVVNGLRRE